MGMSKRRAKESQGQPVNESEGDKPDLRTVKKSIFESLTSTTAQITALLVAIAALVAAIPPITEGIKTAYCGIRQCGQPSAELPTENSEEPNALAKLKQESGIASKLTPLTREQPRPASEQEKSAKPLTAGIPADNPAKSFDIQAECSDVNFFMVRPDGWDRANEFKAVADPRVFSVITSTDRALFSITLSIAPSQKHYPAIKTAKAFDTWIHNRWPDGYPTHCKSGYSSRRVDLILDSALPAGDYDLMSHLNDDPTVTVTTIRVR
jgi:hypothetical protein